MDTEKEVLLSRYKQARESMRAHAILLIKYGHKISEVAKLFFVNEETIRNWINEWEARKELKDMPRSGRNKKLTNEIKEEICKIVDENKPEKYGTNASAWDCKELKIWLQNKYGVDVTSEIIRRTLRNNGFRYKKLNYKFIKADEEKREEFLSDLNELLDTMDGTLIFQDEMAGKLHPNKGYVWTRESKPFIETECSHEKTYFIGGVDPDKGKAYTMNNKKFNSSVFIEFLTLILVSVKEDIFLFLDNHPAHHSKMVTKFVENNPRLNFIFLPKYSPDLNPQENLWNYIRKKFMNNKLFKTVEAMGKEVTNFIESIPETTVKSVCSYDYLLG